MYQLISQALLGSHIVIISFVEKCPVKRKSDLIGRLESIDRSDNAATREKFITFMGEEELSWERRQEHLQLKLAMWREIYLDENSSLLSNMSHRKVILFLLSSR